MSESNGGDFKVVFRSNAVPPDDLFVRSLHGREAISSLYDFDLVVETTFGGSLDQDDLDGLLSQPCYFAFGEAEEHKFHGYLREVEMLAQADIAQAVYRFRFVPRLFDTTLTFGSWVYQDLSAPEIVKDVLDEAGWHDGDDYEIRVTGQYTKYEYKVQYQETDFNFISRVMEHEGLFYYFEHTDTAAKLIVADNNSAFRPREGYESVPYEPRQGVMLQQEVITALSRTQRVIPKKVTLRDYNYRTPSSSLTAENEVDAELGQGEQVYYGEHYKDVGAGRRLARIRAQEHFAQRVIFRGSSVLRGLRNGDKFALEGHPIAAFDSDYVVTSVLHEVNQEGLRDNRPSESVRAYLNSFTLLPYEVAFRPQQVTPKPRIVGVIHGKVDAAADGDRHTPLDEHGRYKVLLPWDVAGKNGGKASRWIRMAQAASGAGYGVQFPLHIGTEVLITHIDGDPDRPIIQSSAPNFETASPVNSGNASQSQMRTRHGITVTFDDSAG
ncbi:MAG: type VI secretion system tip protein VgrG [Myxococcales bacterium]|nr:type VI secretion system tip protein VgrG [Myxococcales bacterium]